MPRKPIVIAAAAALALAPTAIAFANAGIVWGD